MMQHDLAAARLQWLQEAQTDGERDARERSDFLSYQDEDGLFADFHTNRHAFVSNLGKSGASLTEAHKAGPASRPEADGEHVHPS